jgi:TnpA family transposase
MAHRPILTDKQQEDILNLPITENDLLKYYVLSSEDLHHINAKRKPSNRLGFALQLCAFRYPGRLLQKSEIIPQQVLIFIAEQLALSAADLETYGVRPETRYEHSSELQRLYDFKIFQEIKDDSFSKWLVEKAIHTRNNVELVSIFAQECRDQKIIFPGMTVIERLCADARVAAERRLLNSFLYV